MKLLMTLLLFVSTSVFALDDCFTGSWYEAETSDGRGMNLEILDGTVAGYFYTWRGADRRELFILIGDNDSDSLITMKGYQSIRGGTAEVGTVTLDILDNNTMIFTNNWQYDHLNIGNTMRWCLHGGCSGVFEYTRLTQPIACE